MNQNQPIKIKDLPDPRPEYFCGPHAGGVVVQYSTFHTSKPSLCTRAMRVSWVSNRPSGLSLQAWAFSAS